ncbi:hypothetical protein [Mucilaginibacter sp. SG564]|uniref:hypothetical protein n=1 Tax=Mucilaginibacter sp. SG564 TaxID=2587022 RepID=UPI001552C364|nr:hypothetical protein [Mucilaginibacter sp. SG564]NOW98772.1 hypothetical protein [Mucilaginibacter sp. SG564]
MINTIKNSLAYRLPTLYRKLLRHKKIVVSSSKPQADLTVITMTGKKIMDMTRLSILSIARYWDNLPKLIVASDGTISTEEICKNLSFWPGELVATNWEQTEAYHLAKNRTALVNYAHGHVLGKKMAVILHYAEIEPVVWIDSDILFYGDFLKHIPPHGDFICGGSEEGYSVYDDRALNFFNNNLYDVYKFSSGLLLIYGQHIYEQFNLEELLTQLPNHDHYFTEQTIFAHMASTSAGILWSMDAIKNFNHDNQQIKPMSKNNVLGRHYTVNVRHLFWRDAFFNL